MRGKEKKAQTPFHYLCLERLQAAPVAALWPSVWQLGGHSSFTPLPLPDHPVTFLLHRLAALLHHGTLRAVLPGELMSRQQEETLPRGKRGKDSARRVAGQPESCSTQSTFIGAPGPTPSPTLCPRATTPSGKGSCHPVAHSP